MAEIQSRLDGKERNYDFLDELTYYVLPSLLAGEKDGRPLAWRILEGYGEVGGVPAYDWIQLNPEIEKLRRDSRFVAIAERSRDRFLETRAVLLAAKAGGRLPGFLDGPLAEVSRDLGIDATGAVR